MKLIIVILVLALSSSCDTHLKTQPSDIQNETGSNGEAPLNEKFSVVPGMILKDYNTWYTYTYYHVQLSQDFIGLDTDSTKISKTTFLNKLMTEKVVAFKIRLLQGEPVYKLYKLDINDAYIKSTIKQMASTEMKNYKMEGQQIPAFNFTDLKGNNYNTTSTKGKILLLKCWFVHCTACVQEFPKCNSLVDEYGGRNDVLFISLASDTKNNLEKFLKTKAFKYAVIPQTDNYMTGKLNINMYPTHLLVDKTGKIVKVVNSIEELKPFLKKEI